MRKNRPSVLTKYKKDMNDDQKIALDTLASGKDIFLTGDAGTGKSYVLERYINYLDECETRVTVLAPTGITALNLPHGSTIHRAFSLRPVFQKPERNVSVEKILAEEDILDVTDVLIIDEISMVRVDLFEHVAERIRKARIRGCKIQVVLVGDFFQLPPVVTADDEDAMEYFYPENPNGWCFKSPSWKDLDLTVVCLREVVRQKDSEYLNALNLARYGEEECKSFFNRYVKTESAAENALWLCPMRYQAESINKKRLAQLPGKEVTYQTKIDGEYINADELPAPFYLDLKIGARVMILANSDEYCNGTMGYVVELDNDHVRVRKDDGKETDLWPHNWYIYGYKLDKRNGDLSCRVVATVTQIPLRLAYAVTVHKAQGQTFDKVAINSKGFFCAGQMYVALSRCSNPQGLTITPKVNPQGIVASREVLEFYKESNYPPA